MNHNCYIRRGGKAVPVDTIRFIGGGVQVFKTTIPTCSCGSSRFIGVGASFEDQGRVYRACFCPTCGVKAGTIINSKGV